MNDEYTVTCKVCGKVDPTDCNRADCPLESYFWSLTEESND